MKTPLVDDELVKVISRIRLGIGLGGPPLR